MKTGAIQQGIGRLALRFKDRPSALIIVIMLVFGLGGTTEGMWEETLGFFALLVPLALALGYDRMTGAAIIFFGAGTGVLASTVNPFATGVASDAAGIEIGDGIGLRVAMWIVLMAVGIAYVLRYARRVRADNSKSVMGPEGMTSGGLRMADEVVGDVEPLDSRQKLILTLFFGAFAIMIYGFVPWADIWDTIFNADWPFPTFNSFYFAQATVLFLVVSVIIGLIYKLGEKGTVDAIVDRCRRVPRCGADHRPRPGRDRGDEELLHHRHDPALDRERGDRPQRRGVRLGGDSRQPADRLPGPVVVRARRPGDADPRAAGRLRGRAAIALGDRVSDRVGAGEPDHPDLGGDHGRADAGADRL